MAWIDLSFTTVIAQSLSCVQLFAALWIAARQASLFSTASQTLLKLRASPVALGVKSMPTDTGDIRDVGSIPGLGRSPGGGDGNSLQYSCLEKAMDRGVWWAIVHGITVRHGRVTNRHTHTHSINLLVQLLSHV